MSKPFLIIQLRPEDATADSEFEAILRYSGLGRGEVRRVRAEQAALPELELADYAAVIVGGSPFDVTTPDPAKSDVQRRVEADFRRLFDELVPRDHPFLGCCSGCGLLGSYCGAPISRRHAEPVGGADITLTDQGLEDPLLKGLPRSFRVLLGHKEACDAVPSSCVLLAGSDACPVQMFRLRSNIYATQFHPEGDPEGFTLRINVYRHHGYFPPETAADLIARVADERTPWAQAILRRFVERYRTA